MTSEGTPVPTPVIEPGDSLLFAAVEEVLLQAGINASGSVKSPKSLGLKLPRTAGDSPKPGAGPDPPDPSLGSSGDF